MIKTAAIISGITLFLVFLAPGRYIGSALDGGANDSGSGVVSAMLACERYISNYLSPTLFDDNHVVAYYGHPNSRYMGILGRFSKPRLAELVKKEAANYDLTNGKKGTVPAFYLIYGTCHPGGEIGLLPRQKVIDYIEFCLSNGILIYIDHQIGRYPIEKAMNALLPFLYYPNVHLAIDPEWHTTMPMKQIGSVTADELNRAQKMMRDYMISNRIGGKRQLVFHQFHYSMVRGRESVKASYDPVILVHATSGWGSPDLKKGTHYYNSQARNMPYKAFKLWYPTGMGIKGEHADYPLMSPRDVLSLNPQPGLIIYQ